MRLDVRVCFGSILLLGSVWLSGCGGSSATHSTPPVSSTTVVFASGYSTLDAALGACPDSGACTIQFPTGLWTTTFYAGHSCISRSNLTLQGVSVPQFDSSTAPTKLVGGTIIQPGLAFCGASNITLSNIGFDDGPAYFTSTGIASDGLVFEGASGGSDSSDPLVSNVSVSNEIALGSSSNAQFHGNLFEHINGVQLNHIAAALDTHCNVIKSQNVTASYLSGAGCGNEGGLIVKSDGYTSVSNVSAQHITASNLTPGDTGSGVIIDAEGPNPMTQITISDVQTSGVQFAINLLNNSPAGDSALQNVSITGVNAVLSDMPPGRTPSCLLSQTNSANHAMVNIHVTNFACVNATAMAAAPVEIYNDWLNSTISNWTDTNGGYCSTLGGTITIAGWADNGSPSNIPTFCTQDASTVVNVTGYSSTRGNSPYGPMAPGSVLTVSP